MIVRPVRHSDRRPLLRLAKAMRAESLIPFPEISETRGWAMIVAARWLPNRFYFRVVEEKGRVIGFLTGFKAGHTYAYGHAAVHDIWYVAPAHRGSSAARRLVGDFLSWSEEIGAYRTVMSVHTGLRKDRTGKFLERMGFVHMGGVYCKDG